MAAKRTRAPSISSGDVMPVAAVALRDFFAAQCMIGILAQGRPGGAGDYAALSYELADAMMRARGRG